MIFVKNSKFLHFFILFKIGKENVFYDILYRKNAFLDYKNIKIKRQKIGIFPKGLVHDFFQKLAMFSSFCFRQNKLGKCVLGYP